MKNPTQRIKSLLQYLPSKDVPLGERLLEKRDIEQLKMLIDSALYLTKKNQVKEDIPEKYRLINAEKLEELKSEVDNYHSLLANIFEEEEYESELDGEIFDMDNFDTI